MVQLPFIGFPQQFFLGKPDLIPFCQLANDLLEFFLVWFPKVDGNSKSCHQGEFLLDGIVGVELFVPLLLIPEGLPDEMAPVGGGIDQDVVRLFLKTALDHGFQVFIFNLKFLKGKIIHINDKTIVTVFDLGDDFIKVLELMLIGLNDTKSLIIILVQDSLDTGRFTGSRITKEQAVVRLSPLYK